MTRNKTYLVAVMLDTEESRGPGPPVFPEASGDGLMCLRQTIPQTHIVSIVHMISSFKKKVNIPSRLLKAQMTYRVEAPTITISDPKSGKSLII